MRTGRNNATGQPRLAKGADRIPAEPRAHENVGGSGEECRLFAPTGGVGKENTTVR